MNAYVAFDHRGCPNQDCGGVSSPLGAFVNFAESITGTQANLDTLSDADVNILRRGLSAGLIGIDFIGGVYVKLGAKGTSKVVGLSLSATKELTTARSRDTREACD